MSDEFSVKLDTSEFGNSGKVIYTLLHKGRILCVNTYYVVTEKIESKKVVEPENSGDKPMLEKVLYMLDSIKRGEGRSFTSEQYRDLMVLKERFGNRIEEIPEDELEIYLIRNEFINI